MSTCVLYREGKRLECILWHWIELKYQHKFMALYPYIQREKFIYVHACVYVCVCVY